MTIMKRHGARDLFGHVGVLLQESQNELFYSLHDDVDSSDNEFWDAIML
jgi:hypothetical protein